MIYKYLTAFIILICIFLFSLPYTLYSSKIKPDEEIIIYPTIACFHPEDNMWHVDIHAHVFEGEDDSIIRNTLIRFIKSALGIEDLKESEILRSRLRFFLSDNQRRKIITIVIEGKDFTLEKTKANGHVRQTLKFTDKDFRKLAGDDFKKSVLNVQVKLPADDRRSFSGKVFIPGKNSTVVISDIDDTIKISDVRDKKKLVSSTFLEKFKAVPGMAKYYRTLHKRDFLFCYVSASPWQLFTGLNTFIVNEKFPEGIFEMKDFRAKDSDFFNLFDDPYEYKIQTISSIIEKMPGVNFILAGDNGEKDPEAYGELARRYPQRILKIIIREAYSEDETGRYKNAFKDISKDRIKLFKNASDIN